LSCTKRQFCKTKSVVLQNWRFLFDKHLILRYS
jgi:hypothetical protein